MCAASFNTVSTDTSTSTQSNWLLANGVNYTKAIAVSSQWRACRANSRHGPSFSGLMQQLILLQLLIMLRSEQSFRSIFSFEAPDSRLTSVIMPITLIFIAISQCGNSTLNVRLHKFLSVGAQHKSTNALFLSWLLGLGLCKVTVGRCVHLQQWHLLSFHFKIHYKQ